MEVPSIIKGTPVGHSLTIESIDAFDWDHSTLIGSGRMSIVMACVLTSTIPASSPQAQNDAEKGSSQQQCVDGNASSLVLRNDAYAIKSISKARILRTRGAIDRLHMEKKILIDLRMDPHPGIASCYTTLQSEESVYFVLELSKGGDLMQYLRQHGAIPLADLRILMAQLVDTLCYLRRKGVVHRDIKPENLCFRTPGNSLFLIDFEHAVYGTAEPTSATAYLPEDSVEDPEQEYTLEEIHSMRRKSEAFCGTVTTISPEMLCSSAWSYASDLWALGCVLHMMLTGCEPFGKQSDSLIDSMRRIVHGEWIPPPRSKCDDDPKMAEAAWALVRELLQKDPERRAGTTKCGGFDSLRQHPFFEEIEWSNIFQIPVLQDRPPLLSLEYVKALHEEGDAHLTEESLKKIFAPLSE